MLVVKIISNVIDSSISKLPGNHCADKYAAAAIPEESWEHGKSWCVPFFTSLSKEILLTDVKKSRLT